MLGALFYYFRNYGDAIAQSYHLNNGMLKLETDMSGDFMGRYMTNTTLIFTFNNVKEAIALFRKEIERLNNG